MFLGYLIYFWERWTIFMNKILINFVLVLKKKFGLFYIKICFLTLWWVLHRTDFKEVSFSSKWLFLHQNIIPEVKFRSKGDLKRWVSVSNVFLLIRTRWTFDQKEIPEVSGELKVSVVLKRWVSVEHGY